MCSGPFTLLEVGSLLKANKEPMLNAKIGQFFKSCVTKSHHIKIITGFLCVLWTAAIYKREKSNNDSVKLPNEKAR